MTNWIRCWQLVEVMLKLPSMGRCQLTVDKLLSNFLLLAVFCESNIGHVQHVTV
jgi:hypothetical protein